MIVDTLGVYCTFQNKCNGNGNGNVNFSK
jgi:hypothetical protein